MSGTQTDAGEVGDRLREIQTRIRAAAERAGRPTDEVTLVGVTKRQPIARIAEAVRAGVTTLGENYVQEARGKREILDQSLDELGVSAQISWRMIGQLQRNKVRQAVELFDVIESVDRVKLAREIDKRAAAIGRVLDVLLQVNLDLDLDGEAHRGGSPRSEVPTLLRDCASLEHLRVVGLMGMPAAGADAAEIRTAFSGLRDLRDSLRGELESVSAGMGRQFRELSMGMSADYEIAVEEGATHIRIGTALFGPREERT